MGHSQTIHCIGETRSGRLYHAMNKLQVWQESAKSIMHGEAIQHWYYQTKTGAKILGLQNSEDWYILASDIKIGRGVITCPVCGDLPSRTGCAVCNFSGYTTKKYVEGFQEWQIKEIRGE